jgi:hypothetical protein
MRLFEVLLGQCQQQSAHYFVEFPPSCVGYLNKLFRNIYGKKTGRVKSEDHHYQRPHPSMRSPKNSCNKAVIVFVLVFLQCCRSFYLSMMSDVGHVSCRKHLLCPKILPLVGVYCNIWYFLVRICTAECFQQHTVSVQVMFKNKCLLC